MWFLDEERADLLLAYSFPVLLMWVQAIFFKEAQSRSLRTGFAHAHLSACVAFPAALFWFALPGQLL